jgi:hypothetical protein
MAEAYAGKRAQQDPDRVAISFPSENAGFQPALVSPVHEEPDANLRGQAPHLERGPLQAILSLLPNALLEPLHHLTKNHTIAQVLEERRLARESKPNA